MSLVFSINEKEFSRQIAEVIRVTGKSAGEVVRQEGKLFVKDVVKMTPPFGTAPTTESLNAQRKVGQKAVERDVRRTFITLDFTKIREARIRKQLEKLARKNDLEGVKRLLRACRFPVREVLREASMDAHQAQRDRRGRVQRSKFIWVLKDRGTRRVIRERKSHVGKAKSGWAKAARGLGVHLTGWISKHSGAGVFVDRTKDPRQPMIRVGNNVRFIQGTGAQLKIVNRALKNRVRNMKAKLERIVKSGWKRR